MASSGNWVKGLANAFLTLADKQSQEKMDISKRSRSRSYCLPYHSLPDDPSFLLFVAKSTKR
jgi:hypothetical protein